MRRLDAFGMNSSNFSEERSTPPTHRNHGGATEPDRASPNDNGERTRNDLEGDGSLTERTTSTNLLDSATESLEISETEFSSRTSLENDSNGSPVENIDISLAEMDRDGNVVTLGIDDLYGSSTPRSSPRATSPLSDASSSSSSIKRREATPFLRSAEPLLEHSFEWASHRLQSNDSEKMRVHSSHAVHQAGSNLTDEVTTGGTNENLLHEGAEIQTGEYRENATTAAMPSNVIDRDQDDEEDDEELFADMDQERVREIKEIVALELAENESNMTEHSSMFDDKGMTYRMKKIMSRMNKKQNGKELLEIYVNNRKATRESWRGWIYPENYVRTTNYTLLTFLPKNLTEQFRRIANIYFLIVMILTQIPGVSPLMPWTAIFPLLFILSVNALKDGFEDWKRHLADRRANGKSIAVVRDGKMKQVKTSEVCMGDVVRIDRGREVPADIVILSSERNDGVCHVETANLDGETNLKTKKAVSKYMRFKDAEQLSTLKAKIYVEQPNEDLGRFEGKIVPLVDQAELDQRMRDSIIQELAKRAKSLDAPTSNSPTRNDAKDIYAMSRAVKRISSTECLSTSDSTHKQSTTASKRTVTLHSYRPKTIGDLVELEAEGVPLSEENLLLRGCVLRNTKHVFGVVVYVGQNTKLFKNLKKKRSKFSFLDKKMNLMLFFVFLSQQVLCVLFALLSSLFQNQVTGSSFYVHNPVVADFEFAAREYLSYFILMSTMVPISLFVTLEFVKAFQARSMESDPMMSHNGVTMRAKTSHLNQELSQIDVILSDKTGTLTDNKMEFVKCWFHGQTHDDIQNPGGLRQLLTEVAHPDSVMPMEGESRSLLHLFLLCIVLNHTVIPEYDSDRKELIFEGQSADEVALLKAAQNNGYVLKERTAEGMKVEILGNMHSFRVMESIPFNSDRKRMTVFVKHGNNRVMMFSKGADAVMFKRSVGHSAIQGATRAVNDFSIDGLRTLVFCYRELTMEEFNAWHRRYQHVSLSFRNREKKMGDVASEIEHGMAILGCTGIEDKLQEGVPDSIEYLMRAGFQIWVLTGDKTQTAVNIAYSAKLLQNGVTKEIKILARTKTQCKKRLRHALEYISVRKAEGIPFALIIDANALHFALRRYSKLFVKLVSQCQTCICCRVTPLQKARVTYLVKKHLKRKCLAIGDGANDVSMIQTALVGVGILGNEGGQAARASDFAIPRFKHLPRLLCVHGRYSAVRNADFLHLSIWKNWILSFVGLLFACFNGFTAQTLFDSWIMMFYNSIFTSLPPFVAGAFEKDLEEDIIMRHPDLYKHYKNNALFNSKTFSFWFLLSVFHSCVMFFMFYFLSGTGMIGTSFTTNRPVQDGLWSDSSVLIVVLFLVCMLKHMMETKYFGWAQHLQFWISVALFFGYLFLYPLFPLFFGVSIFYYVPYEVALAIKPYLSIILIVFVTLLPDFLLKYIKRNFFPSDWEKVLLHEHSRKKKKKQKHEEESDQDQELLSIVQHDSPVDQT